MYILIKEKYLEKWHVIRDTFVDFLVISALHFHLCWLLHVSSFSAFTRHVLTNSCYLRLCDLLTNFNLLPSFAFFLLLASFPIFAFVLCWVFHLLRFSIFCLLHKVSSVLSFFFIFVVRFFHLHFQFLFWFSVEFLLLCMFSS